jgi:hypothetical protein
MNGMHKYKFDVIGKQTIDVFMDKEDLKTGDLVVIGSTIYKVVEMESETAMSVVKVGDKLYVGMLSEW